MGDENRRQALLFLKSLDLSSQLNLVVTVEVAERFVEEDEFRVPDEGPAKSHPLLSTTAETPDVILPDVRHAEEPQRVINLRFNLGPRSVSNLERKGDVLGDGQVGIQRIILEDHGDVALARSEAAYRMLIKIDLSLRRLLDACDHFQRRALATPRGTEKGHQLAVLTQEVQILYGFDRAIVLVNVLETNGCHRFKSTRSKSKMGRLTTERCRRMIVSFQGNQRYPRGPTSSASPVSEFPLHPSRGPRNTRRACPPGSSCAAPYSVHREEVQT